MYVRREIILPGGIELLFMPQDPRNHKNKQKYYSKKIMILLGRMLEDKQRRRLNAAMTCNN